MQFMAGVGTFIECILTVLLPGIAGRNPAPDRPTPRPPEYRP